MLLSLKTLNGHLKAYDSLLEVKETKLGRYDVYRKSQFACKPPHLIFSLTDTWTASGIPRNWGIDVILDRLKAHDLWSRADFVENYMKSLEKDEEIRDKDRRNNIEAFLYDFAGQFRKTFSDVNTSTMNKLYRKEGSHGYHQPRSGFVSTT